MANWDIIFVSRVIDEQINYSKINELGIQPDDLVDPMAKQILREVEKFWAKHGKTPSIEFIQDIFPEFQPVTTEDPFEVIATKVVSAAMQTKIRYNFERLRSEFDKNPWAACSMLEDFLMSVRSRFRPSTSLVVDVKQAIESFEKRYEEVKSGVISGVPYPWATLNEITRGAQPGELVAFYASPKMCKTWLLCVCAVNCLAHNKKVLISSREMHPEVIFQRLLALKARVDYSRLTKARLLQEELDDIELAKHWFLQNQNLLKIIDSRGGSGITTVASVREAIRTFNPDVVLIDSIHRMDDERAKSKSDFGYFYAVTQGLKDLALAHNLPVIVTSQANRYGRVGRSFQDVGFGLSLAQDADLLIRVYHSKKRKLILMIITGSRETDIDHFFVEARIAQSLTKEIKSPEDIKSIDAFITMAEKEVKEQLREEREEISEWLKSRGDEFKIDPNYIP